MSLLVFFLFRPDKNLHELKQQHKVIDLDPSDATVEVICAEFFGGRLTMHSVCGGGGGLSSGARPSVTESWVLDDNAGPAYAVTAADLR